MLGDRVDDLVELTRMLAMVPPTFFAPWGTLVRSHAEELLSPSIPADWRPSLLDPIARRAAWDAWWNNLLDRLGDAIWPKYEGGKWTGAATAQMGPLTGEDFELMAELFPRFDDSVASPGNKVHVGVSHGVLFHREDKGRFGQSFAVYSEALADTVSAVSGETSLEWIDHRIMRKAGSLDLHLKNGLQRPRAYQVSRQLGDNTFRHQVADSANTPSMISGHGLHGMIAGMAVNETLLRAGKNDPDILAGLAQYAVDFGDRRVLAGVHYPSDNISSWLCCCRIARECFVDAKAAQDFVRQAVDLSFVAVAIKAHVAKHPNGAMAGAWTALQAELWA